MTGVPAIEGGIIMIKKDEDVQLMELYKKTMDNVNMSPYKKDEIRDSLVSQTPMVGTKT